MTAEFTTHGRIDFCLFGTQLTVAHDINGSGGLLHNQPYHVHISPGVTDSPLYYVRTGTNYMGVGGYDGDEYQRGIMLLDLTNMVEFARKATLRFEVRDSTVFGGNGNNGVLGGDPFRGTLELVGGNHISAAETDAFHEAGQYLGSWDVDSPAVGTQYEMDITWWFNQFIGSNMFLRLQDKDNDLESFRPGNGATLFGNACILVKPGNARGTGYQSSTLIQGQQIGVNEGGWTRTDPARGLEDTGQIEWFYVDPAEIGSTVMDSNGEPTSGNAKLTIYPRVGEKWPLEQINISWTGGGTLNGQSSPIAWNPTSGTAQATWNTVGSVKNLSVKRASASSEFTSTFLSRMSRMSAMRVMSMWGLNDTEWSTNVRPYVRERQLTGSSNRFYMRFPNVRTLARASNATGVPLWLCIHVDMTDIQLQTMMSDLISEGYPSWRPLFIEHGNECWNSKWHTYQKLNSRALASGNYPSAPGEAARVQYLHADRTYEIAQVVQSIRPSTNIVLAGQADTTGLFIRWFETTPGRMPIHDISSIPNLRLAANGYFGGPLSKALPTGTSATSTQLNGLGVRDIDDRVKGVLSTWLSNAASKGLLLDLYEFGQHYDHADVATDDYHSTLMNSTVHRHGMAYFLDWWRAQPNAGMALYYQSVGKSDEPWSFREGELLSAQDRFLAISDRL